jgi:GT2 family glycosyltransferase
VKTLLKILWRLIRSLPLLLVLPLLIAAPLVALALCDLLWAVTKRWSRLENRRPSTAAASVVIPNWNGRDLLEKYLPPLIAAMEENPRNEIIVVDNGSTDGSAAFLRDRFPGVRLIALYQNLGFGGGCNAGVRAASNDIVVLLNSDMRVAHDFLAPLLEAFQDELVFAVSCQIFFSDPQRLREETGLTQGWWENGGLRVRHRIDDAVREPYPCFYGGGGSCAFDRAKFLELGGFDELLAPFYLEDTDLGYMAWKRGWKVLYEPRSIVYHEHRGTIGKRFSQSHIDVVLKKNFVLFCWKNIHEWPRITSHFFFTGVGAALSLMFGDSPERAGFGGLRRALLQLPGAVRSRRRARGLAIIDDTEAFRRPLGGYFRDRFCSLAPDPDPLSVVFVSPYPICPPVHGGAVFMYQTTRELARLVKLHLIVLLDHEHERGAHSELEALAASAEYLVRMEGRPKEFGSIAPYAVREFANANLEWLIHRTIYVERADVLQLEYTALAQYVGDFNNIVCILFEHDIYFQSIGRQLPRMRRGAARVKAAFEYLRAMRFELRALPRFDRVQVCSPENATFLRGFVPELAGRIDEDVRAGIDTSAYDFRQDDREPDTMLFLGSFRHPPNQEALSWFASRVLPRVLAERPAARLVVVGSDPPPKHSFANSAGAIELRGFVEDAREPLGRYALFVCPILSGSGIRVKLLEAFASGIPAVSTRLGAEGLAGADGGVCALADDPESFARKIIELLNDPASARALALRARCAVEQDRDMKRITTKLARSYAEAVTQKRSGRGLPAGL